MAEKSEFLSAAAQAFELRQRWVTQAGRKTLSEVLTLLRKKDESWSDLVRDFVGSSSESQRPDLRGIRVSARELTNIDLSFTDLRYSDFSGSQLSGASFQGALLDWVDFSYCTLVSADLFRTHANNARFDSANLSGSMMMSSSFIGAYFHRANMQSAVLDHSDFSRADVAGADFHAAEMHHTKLAGIAVSSDTKGLPQADSVRDMLGALLYRQSRASTGPYQLNALKSPAVALISAVEAIAVMWSTLEAKPAIFDEALQQLVSFGAMNRTDPSFEVLEMLAMSALRNVETRETREMRSQPDHYSVLVGGPLEQEPILLLPEIDPDRQRHTSVLAQLRSSLSEKLKQFQAGSAELKRMVAADE